MASRITPAKFRAELCFAALRLFRLVLRPFLAANSRSWSVGPSEIAGLVKNYAASIENSVSVSLSYHPFGYGRYDYQGGNNEGFLKKAIFSCVYRPFLLAKLSILCKGFLYVGPGGFLSDFGDEREREFQYLRSKGKRIVCALTGSDIRSVRLMLEEAEILGQENLGSALSLMGETWGSEDHETLIRKRCRVIERQADLVFNVDRDQRTYFEVETAFLPVIVSDTTFHKDFRKFASPDPPIIFHAPSNPILKGTQVVRSVVRQLRACGYHFVYQESIREPHDEVVAKLRSAHIVVNELYSYVPGVLGFEAMANCAVLVTRANGSLEPGLPHGADEAWVSAGPDDLLPVLRDLLDSPNGWVPQALLGFEWASLNASRAIAGKKLADYLERLLQTN